MSLISFRTDRDQATARAASGPAWGVILLTGVPDQRPRRGPADIEEVWPGPYLVTTPMFGKHQGF